MNVITQTDVEALTLTTRADLSASLERAWQLVSDPRKLERWWGPPEWRAKFLRFEFEPEGRAHYCMRGPDGEESHGWWRFVSITEPREVSIEDGFADGQGEPTGDLGVTTVHIAFEPIESGTRVTIVSGFESAEQLDEMVKMGMDEGIRSAVGQMQQILDES